LWESAAAAAAAVAVAVDVDVAVDRMSIIIKTFSWRVGIEGVLVELLFLFSSVSGSVLGFTYLIVRLIAFQTQSAAHLVSLAVWQSVSLTVSLIHATPWPFIHSFILLSILAFSKGGVETTDNCLSEVCQWVALRKSCRSENVSACI